MLSVLVGVKKAFASLHQKKLKSFLGLSGIAMEITGLLSGMNVFNCGIRISNLLPVSIGIRQRRVHVPIFFSVCMDWV